MVQSLIELPRGIKLKAGLVLVLCLLTISFSIFAASPGHLSIDEIVYHLMARSLYTAGSLDVLNGYRDFPSVGFVFPTTLVYDGRLVSQYPVSHSVLALPFYAATPGKFSRLRLTKSSNGSCSGISVAMFWIRSNRASKSPRSEGRALNFFRSSRQVTPRAE